MSKKKYLEFKKTKKLINFIKIKKKKRTVFICFA